MNRILILIVEDDAPVRNLISTTLKTHDYRYIIASNGQNAIMEASTHNPDIVLLDLGLPDMDGVEIIKTIRTWSNMPIIVISARSEDTDKIEALDCGADDYLTKPFAMKELLARVRSMTRRRNEYSGNELTFGDLTLNAGQLELVSANSVRLSGKECDLMQLLILNAGRELHTDYLLEQVWENEQDAQSDTVWLYISYLRNKLRAVDSGARIVGEKGESFIIISSEDRSAD